MLDHFPQAGAPIYSWLCMLATKAHSFPFLQRIAHVTTPNSQRPMTNYHGIKEGKASSRGGPIFVMQFLF